MQRTYKTLNPLKLLPIEIFNFLDKIQENYMPSSHVKIKQNILFLKLLYIFSMWSLSVYNFILLRVTNSAL